MNYRSGKLHFIVWLSILSCHIGWSTISQTPFYHSVEPVKIDSIGLRELVIEASKDQLIYKRLPVSISLITSRDITNMGGDRMGDLNILVPNLIVHEQGTRLSSPIYIRGIGSKLNQPSVGMYVDNVPYYSKGMMNFDWYDIHRIEVLRGPQGTEYGRNTMGGIINISTRSPLNFQGITLQAKSGMYGDYQIGGGYYAKPTDQWAYSFAGNIVRRSGYFTNDYDKSHPDKIQSEGFRTRLIYRNGGNLSVENILSVEHSHQYGFPYASYDLTSGHLGQINYNEPGGYERHLINNAVVIRSRNWGWGWQSTSAIQYFKGKQSIDQDLTAKPVFYVMQGETQYLLSQDFSAHRKVGHSLSLLFGLNAFYHQTASDVDVKIEKNKINSLKAYNNPMWGAAFYHQTRISDLFLSGLDLTLGVRADMERAQQHYKQSVKSSKGVKVIDDTDLIPINSLILLPKIALTYRVHNHNLYGVIAKGYKTGGYNTSFDTKQHASFKPEKSWNYEVGIKSSFFDHQLFTEVSLFFIDWQQQQIYKRLEVGAMLVNAGHTVSQGLELSARTALINGYQLMVGYGATKAKYITNKRDDQTNYGGKYLPYVPHHTFNAVLSKQIDLPRHWVINQLVGLIRYRGMGKIYFDDDNVLEQPFYNVWDLRCSFRRPGMHIDIWGDNVTDVSYLSHLFHVQSNYFAQPGIPFRCGITLSLNINQ